MPTKADQLLALADALIEAGDVVPLTILVALAAEGIDIKEYA
jgi:hypothetical protein